MKYAYYLFFVLLFRTTIQAQEKKENKVFYGFQIGLVETLVYQEVNLNESISFKTGLGLVGGITNSALFVTPKIELQPKWNFSKKKRILDEKEGQYNASNYVSLALSYVPKWSTLPAYEDRMNEKIQVIPTIGLKRSFNQQFNYEMFFGLGYERNLQKEVQRKDNLAVKLGVLIGIDF